MTIETISVHIVLSILVFFTINWLGKHSTSLGYVTLTAFVKNDDAPAFNLIFRVFSPLVLIIILASIFYSLKLDKYVQNIWLVTLFYCLGRFIFILLFDRIFLVNWVREIFIWVTSTGISWIIYENFIKLKSNLLPQPENLTNEFWILLILFVYSALNQIEINSNATIKRKQQYLRKTYALNKKKYHSIIASQSVDSLCESFIYAVLLYESFNRPKLIRTIEKLTFPHIAKSLGPMQVKTDKMLTDYQSVTEGSARVVRSYLQALKMAKERAAEKEVEFNPYTESRHMRYLQYKVAAEYNKDDSYVDGLSEMHDHVIENLYPSFKAREARTDWADFYIS